MASTSPPCYKPSMILGSTDGHFSKLPDGSRLIEKELSGAQICVIVRIPLCLPWARIKWQAYGNQCSATGAGNDVLTVSSPARFTSRMRVRQLGWGAGHDRLFGGGKDSSLVVKAMIFCAATAATMCHAVALATIACWGARNIVARRAVTIA